jgi:hypothetical protein
MLEHRDRKGKEAENTSQRHDRKPYVKPKLIEYGHLEKLTEGATGTSPEPGGRRPH